MVLKSNAEAARMVVKLKLELISVPVKMIQTLDSAALKKRRR
jgi:hypothetical protein